LRVLISTYNKKGLEKFAKELVKMGCEIIATSGTAKFLKKKKIPVLETKTLTGFEKILKGKVKTLHPLIFAGILATEKDPDIKKHKIPLIDMVVVNFYSLNRRKVDETIDIGGVSLLRAGAKNYRRVIPVCDPADYSMILKHLENGGVPQKIRKELAKKAFLLCAKYNGRIVEILDEKENIPWNVFISMSKILDLKYGENPHQKGAFYSEKGFPGEVLQGEPLSYNNILDIDSAINCVRDFSKCACAIVKHTNPCGVSENPSQVKAFKEALLCDPLSAFGGIVAFNRKVDGKTAKIVKKHFFEVICAPDFTEEALKIFSAKKKLILFKYKNFQKKFSLRTSLNGFILQENKTPSIKVANSTKKLSKEKLKEILFGAKVVFRVASNATVVVKGTKTIGIAGGQPSRIDSVKLALKRAKKMKKNLKGCILITDGFFPFDDSIKQAFSSGIKTIAAPFGSIRDSQICKTAKNLKINLVLL